MFDHFSTCMKWLKQKALHNHTAANKIHLSHLRPVFFSNKPYSPVFYMNGYVKHFQVGQTNLGYVSSFNTFVPCILTMKNSTSNAL